MFTYLGRFVARAWAALLAMWIIVLVVTWVLAPNWEDLAQDREFSFLPAEVPSRVSETLFEKAFPDEQLGSNIVILLRRDDTGTAHLEQDKKFIEDVIEPGLRQIAEAE